MPVCAVRGCGNYAQKGYRLFRFPRNQERRQQWESICGRKNWRASDSSRMCEGHFEISQFELRRADGLKKLKPDALPTIFNIRNPPKPVFSIVNLPEPATEASQDVPPEADHTYVAKGDSSNNEESIPSKLQELLTCDGDAPNPKSDTKETNEKTDSAPQPKKKKLNFQPNFSEKIHHAYNIQIQNLQADKRKLARELSSIKKKLQYLETSLSKFLNPDQIQFLWHQRSDSSWPSVVSWTAETLEIAREIRAVVGPKVYSFIRDRLGYPLPSFRTIYRHLEKKTLKKRPSNGVAEKCTDIQDTSVNLAEVANLDVATIQQSTDVQSISTQDMNLQILDIQNMNANIQNANIETSMS